MSLYKQITDDLKQAMKDRDSETLGVLRLVVSSLKNVAIETKEELKDVDVIAAIKRDVKKMQDAMREFTDAAREDLAAQARKEIDILKKYLPAEMSDEDLEQLVRKTLEENEITETQDIGRAMGSVMKAVSGRADGNRVREMVQKILN